MITKRRIIPTEISAIDMISCDRCGIVVPPINHGLAAMTEETTPPEDGLTLEVHDGYGAFRDDGGASIHLCNNCCKLFATWFLSGPANSNPARDYFEE